MVDILFFFLNLLLLNNWNLFFNNFYLLRGEFNLMYTFLREMLSDILILNNSLTSILLALERQLIKNISFDSSKLRNGIGSTHLVASVVWLLLWLCTFVNQETTSAVDGFAPWPFHRVDGHTMAYVADKILQNSICISGCVVKLIFIHFYHLKINFN